MKKGIENITRKHHTLTPQEFVKSWNKLLVITKRNVETEDQLPKVIHIVDNTEGMRDRLDFVIDRVNCDHEFQQEVSLSIGAPVRLQTIIYNDSIQIVASRHQHGRVNALWV